MKYNFPEDLRSIRAILGLSQREFAEQIGVEQVTVSRNELGKTVPSARILENVYRFAFTKNIRINKLKEMLWRHSVSRLVFSMRSFPRQLLSSSRRPTVVED